MLIRSGTDVRGSTIAGRAHAVVIGGSLTGMTAARVLADLFARVTIVERDRPDDATEVRPGVPQARQVHALLKRGSQIFERLFPGFEAELRGRGARSVCWARDVRWWHFGGWKAAHASELASLACSRFLIEDTVRRRLRADPRVGILAGARAESLLVDRAGLAATGVALADGRAVTADLVVDASGRGSSAPEWLRKLGYEPPAEITVNSFLGYASRVYRRPQSAPAWTGMIVYPTPPASLRGGVIAALEGDRWHVMLFGVGRDYPPTDADAFLGFARTLAVPDLHDAIAGAQPLSPVYGYRHTDNRVRRFDRMPRLLERFVVLGDAACCFNPVYGQGMTVGALGAELLGRCVRGAGTPLVVARRFHRRLAKLLDGPWRLATGEDLRYPETEGGRATVGARLVQRYVDGVIRLGVSDVGAYEAFWQVMHMCKPPTSLFSPRLLARVLAASI